MKVILYIGHHKVGSSALQVFLAQNAATLLRAGILYPCVEMQGFSQLLARVALDGDNTRFLTANPREPHSALAYQMMAEVSRRPIPPQFKMLPSSEQMLHAIRQQVAYLKPHTMVLCSEAFANFGEVSPALVTQLQTAFPNAEVQIYCALRRPDDYLTAWHGQRIKVGENLPPLRDVGLRPYLGTIHTDYRRVVQAWIDKIPDAQVHLRNYADIRATGGSPEDFFARTDVTLPAGLISVGQRNPSLPLAAMEIKRRANMELPYGETEKLAQHMQNKLGHIPALLGDQIEMFGPGQRAKLQKIFTPVQEYLGALTKQEAFFPDFEKIAQPRPVPELEAVGVYLAQIDAAEMPSEPLKRFIAAMQHSFGCSPA